MQQAISFHHVTTSTTIVQASAPGEIVIPFSLHIDAAPYTTVDSVMVISAYTPVTSNRHTLAVLRKKEQCKCGCKGHCTLWEIMEFLKWSLFAASEGVFPRQRHDGSGWHISDAVRASKSGTPLAAKFCLLYLKGDWMEYCTTLGLPSWNSIQPCPWCFTSRDDLYTTSNFSPNSFPHALKSWDTYDAACRGLRTRGSCAIQ